MPFSSDEPQNLQSQVTVSISLWWLKNSTNNIVAALKLLK